MLQGGCTSSSESIHVKMPHCWKSHIAVHFMQSLLNLYKNKYTRVSLYYTAFTEFTSVKAVLLKPYLTNSATFIKLTDITRSLFHRISFNFAET